MAAKPTKQYGSSKRDPISVENPKPSANTVADFHTNADTDSRPESIHHTLGPNPAQSSPGDHTHDGGSSPLILVGFTLTGSRGGNAAMTSLIACLVRLGATDQTTT